MSVGDIEKQIELLTAEEQAQVESFIRLLRKTNSPEYRGRIARAHAEFETGRKVSSDELKRLSQGSAQPEK